MILTDHPHGDPRTSGSTALNESGAQRITSDSSWDSDPTWSPDGVLLAYTRDSGIEVVSVNDNRRRRLTDGSASDSQPAWSPDANRIAYVHGEGPEEKDIYLIATDGADPQRLVSGRGLDVAPVWNPCLEQPSRTSPCVPRAGTG